MPLDVPTALRTLLVGGFHMDNARRMTGHFILDVHRYDQFGLSISYSVAIFDKAPAAAAVQGFVMAARHNGRLPLLVTSESSDVECRRMTVDEFLDHLGGAVDDEGLLRHDLPHVLDSLGHNAVPAGLNGRPEDLLEEQVARCLQHLLQQRAHRWGSDRRFERVPDGVAIGGHGLLLLFDAKANTDAFDLTVDEMRKFGEYVATFHRKYEPHVGRVHAFLVIAGGFRQSTGQLEARSNELYAQVGVSMCFLRASELGTMVQMALAKPRLRSMVDWRRVFSEKTNALLQMQAQVEALARDGLVKEG
jgi:hypothetical protein